jgi:hypothetical protein
MLEKKSIDNITELRYIKTNLSKGGYRYGKTYETS